MSYLGIDSRKFVRKGQIKDFMSVIGIGIEVDDYEKFKSLYVKIMEDLLKKRKIKPDKKIYKSYDLNKLGIWNDFYYEFYDLIKDHIKKIHIFYSYFSKEIQRVKIYPYDGVEEVGILDFMTSHLIPSYPHICMWEINHKDIFDGSVFLDSFSGRVTDSWKEISDKENLFILPNGDKTNALISCSDILITFLDRCLFDNKKKLKKEEIEQIFRAIKDKLNISFISNACLYKIIPLSKRDPIQVIKKIIHPTVYILKEKSEFVDEKAIENSPLLKKVINFCFMKNGCFKFFDSKTDYEGLSEEDYILSFSEDGSKSIKCLKNMGYNFNQIELRDLDNLIK